MLAQYLKATTFHLLPMHYLKQAFQRKVLARHCAEPTRAVVREHRLRIASSFPPERLLTQGAVLWALSWGDHKLPGASAPRGWLGFTYSNCKLPSLASRPAEDRCITNLSRHPFSCRCCSVATVLSVGESDSMRLLSLTSGGPVTLPNRSRSDSQLSRVLQRDARVTG